jgi:DNA-binding transcriptional MocR family regulator
MLDQSIVEELIASGDLACKSSACARSIAGARVLIEELDRHFRGRASWTSGTAACSRSSRCRKTSTPPRVSDAVANGVAFIPGGPFFVDGSGANTMRLTFAKETDADR